MIDRLDIAEAYQRTSGASRVEAFEEVKASTDVSTVTILAHFEGTRAVKVYVPALLAEVWLEEEQTEPLGSQYVLRKMLGLEALS